MFLIRPHHLFILYKNINKDNKNINLYGLEHINRVEEIQNQLHDNSIIQIIKGLDDLCKTCPLKELCKNKNYDKILETFKKAGFNNIKIHNQYECDDKICKKLRIDYQLQYSWKTLKHTLSNYFNI